MRYITHGPSATAKIEGFDGTATLRRRYNDDTMEITLSTAPGILFRVEKARDRHHDRAIIVEGGDLDRRELALLHFYDETDGTTSLLRHAGRGKREYYETYQQVIADVWPAFEARELAELAAEEAEGVPA